MDPLFGLHKGFNLARYQTMATHTVSTMDHLAVKVVALPATTQVVILGDVILSGADHACEII